jgi:streptomycin 6-kinase
VSGDVTGPVVPDDLGERVGSWYGARGAAWVREVPAVVADLATRWALRIGPAYPTRGHALLLPATRFGEDLVLKLRVPDEENQDEAVGLRAYGGDGAVLLHALDESTGAMLLERADPRTTLDRHPGGPVAATEVLCDLLRRLRRPVPDGVRLPSVAEWADRFAGQLPTLARRLPAGCEAVVEAAAALADRYARSPAGPELMLNRDAHLGNVLGATREPWLLVDPRPVAGEAAYEAALPVLRLLDPRADPDVAAPAVAASVAVPAVAGADGAASPAAAPDAAAPDAAAHRAGRPAGGFPPVPPGGQPLPPVGPERAVALVALVGRSLGVDPQRARGWALVRAVGNATWAASLGHDPAPCLRVAGHLHAAG